MFTSKRVYTFAGFIIPSVLFISPSSPILLVTSRLEDGAVFAVPLSLLLLPFLLLWSISKSKIKNSGAWFYLLLGIFFVWLLLLAAYSFVNTSTDSLLFLIQWIVPYLFIYFYATMVKYENLIFFLKGFVAGTIFSCSYTFLAGILEIALYGIGMGRMTQNLILPGFYQLFVYIPTVLAFTSLICMCAVRFRLIHIGRFWTITLYVTSFFAILFTAAIEGFLIYILGLLGIFLLKNKRTILLKICAMIGGVIILLGSVDYVLNRVGETDIMMLQKISQTNYDGNQLRGRDEAIAKFTKVIVQRPFTGTAVLPPFYHPSLGVDASSSAHNYYWDTFAWSGFFGFAIIITLYLLLLIKSVANILRNINSRSPVIRFYILMNFLLILLILLSNNINVPMRQPVTGAIGSLLIYFCIHFESIKSIHKNINIKEYISNKKYSAIFIAENQAIEI